MENKGEPFGFDTEADNLLQDVTKAHCFVFSNLKKTKWRIFCRKEELSEAFIEKLENKYSIVWYELDDFNKWLKTGEVSALICHNSYGYDFPMMKKLGYIEKYDIFPDHIDGVSVQLYDTLGMSRVLHPDRRLPKGCPTSVYNPVTKKMDKVGPHGLMAYGYRVGNMKPVIHDWRGITDEEQEILEYDGYNRQ